MKLGRNRPAPIPRNMRLHLADFVSASLPVPPVVSHYFQKAYQGVKKVNLNDRLGCCVISGAAHVRDVWQGNAGTAPPWIDDATVEYLYEKIGGYDPDDPSTDQGCDEITALRYFKQHGISKDGSHKIIGWASVNGANETLCKQAIYLFENLYFGVELPDAWINPFPSKDGFVWGLAGEANPENGHCFIGGGYNAVGVQIDTWGLIGTLTWPAIKKYATTEGSGELYVLFSQDLILKATQKAPNGFDAKQLGAALAQF